MTLKICVSMICEVFQSFLAISGQGLCDEFSPHSIPHHPTTIKSQRSSRLTLKLERNHWENERKWNDDVHKSREEKGMEWKEKHTKA